MLRHQEWEEHEVAAYDTEQVDIDDAMPCLDRYRFNGSHGEHADVVHDDIDLTEGIERAVAQRGEVLAARHVALDRLRCARRVADLGRDRSGSRDVDVAHDDPAAATRQRHRRGAPDAAATTGDHRHRRADVDERCHGREVTTIAAHKSTRHVMRTTFSAMVKVRST